MEKTEFLKNFGGTVEVPEAVKGGAVEVLAQAHAAYCQYRGLTDVQALYLLIEQYKHYRSERLSALNTNARQAQSIAVRDSLIETLQNELEQAKGGD